MVEGNEYCAPSEAQKVLDREVAECLRRTGMLKGVGRLGVAVSGGADSLALLAALTNTSRDGACALIPIYVDQYLSAAKTELLSEFVRSEFGLGLVVRTQDTRNAAASMVAIGTAPCRACAPIRARELAAASEDLGLDALALGHHLDDAMATLLMNIFHRGESTTFKPVTQRRGPPPYTVVRPLYFSAEATVKAASPAGPSGLFSCGVCNELGAEREGARRFVGQQFQRHPITKKFARDLLRRQGSNTST